MLRRGFLALLVFGCAPLVQAADSEVRAIALNAVDCLDTWLSRQSPKDSVVEAHYVFARFEIDRLRRDPSQFSLVAPVTVPPGSPIGSFQTGTN
jgi:hypothetical protein